MVVTISVWSAVSPPPTPLSRYLEKPMMEAMGVRRSWVMD